MLMTRTTATRPKAQGRQIERKDHHAHDEASARPFLSTHPDKPRRRVWPLRRPCLLSTHPDEPRRFFVARSSSPHIQTRLASSLPAVPFYTSRQATKARLASSLPVPPLHISRRTTEVRLASSLPTSPIHTSRRSTKARLVRKDHHAHEASARPHIKTTMRAGHRPPLDDNGARPSPPQQRRRWRDPFLAWIVGGLATSTHTHPPSSQM